MFYAAFSHNVSNPDDLISCVKIILHFIRLVYYLFIMAKFTYINNPQLHTILQDWKGNPMVDGRFIDPNKRFSGSFKKFLQWRFSKNEKAEAKRKDTWRLIVRSGNEFLKNDSDKLVWLGHASFFIQRNGVRLLIDPVFGRISGVVPRFSNLPCAAEDFAI
jgi:hypothetical protein